MIGAAARKRTTPRPYAPFKPLSCVRRDGASRLQAMASTALNQRDLAGAGSTCQAILLLSRR